MCTVGIDGNLPATLFGWQGKKAASLSRQPWLQDDGKLAQPGNSLLNAKPLLEDDFEELEIHSRVYVASVKLFLTDTHIIVAEDFPDQSPTLTYLRAHNIKEIDIELDQDEPTMIHLTTQAGQQFLYSIRNGAARIAYWTNYIFRLKRDSISPSSSVESTLEERARQQELQPLSSSRSCGQSQDDPQLSINNPPSTPSSTHMSLSSDTSFHDENNTPTKSSSLKRGSGLRRRTAFRNSDFGFFRERTRSSSVPVENLDIQESLGGLSLDLSSISNNTTDKCDHEQDYEDDITQVDSSNIFESPSRHSSLRKGKLKISPRANRFTRALSARLNNSSSNNSLSNTPTSEVRRAKSLNNNSSTLPRPKRNSKKEIRSKTKSSIFDSRTPPVTPTRTPKSPGSLLKRFNRKAGASSLNLEEFLLSMEEGDISTVDVQNKPKQLKLYLQPPLQIAEELTLMNAEMFHNIEQKELQNGAWTKKTKYITSPNILKMIDSFNRLARIVCTEIVHEKTPSSRGKAISNYIKIISKLYKLHNYDSMKAIVSGLQSQAVYRLKRSWSNVPTRRKKKFDKYCEFLSNIDSSEGFKEHMRYNFENNIQCIPYLGWLLTYTLHYQTFKKFQKDNGTVPFRHHHHRTSSMSFPNSKKLFRESVCSLSLPNSPPESENGEDNSAFQSVITNFSAEVLHFTKSVSDSNMLQYTKDNNTPSLPTPDRSSSPQDEIDFDYPNNSQLHPLHPLADKVIVNPLIYSIVDCNNRDSSSDSSVEVQSDIASDCTTGQPTSTYSPAHNQQSTRRQEENDSVHFESIPHPSLSDTEYILPPLDHLSDNDNDYERQDNVFDGSFTRTSCSGGSSSRSPSVISPSMVSFNLISEPTTPHRTNPNQSRLLSICYPQYDSHVNNSVLCISSCGVLFSSVHSSEDMIDLVHIPYHEPAPAEGREVVLADIIEHVRKFFTAPSEKDVLVKFTTPTLSVNDEIVDDLDLVTLPQSPHTPNNHQTMLRIRNDEQMSPTTSSQPFEDDSVFIQYQRNSLCYSCELTSRQHMRSLINKVPLLDENQCHQVSVEIEPS